MVWSKTTPMVAEVQGLYGPFTFSELRLQRIWARGDFDQSRLRTVDGRRLTLEHRGRWNTLAGPDFRQARVRWDDGRAATGDIELHLRAEDWDAHGHAADQAYDGVMLHVVLFPPRANHLTRGGDGRPLPVVALLPLLRHDLEEYAAEEAVEHLADHRTGRLREALLALAPEAVTERLQHGALKRWRQKVHYAGRRAEQLGFTAACHCTALEILGFRFNRVPMLNVAARHSLAEWACVTEADIMAWLREEGANWARVGVRPANHPKLRLGQYAAWVMARPDWPERLLAEATLWPRPDIRLRPRDARSTHGLRAISRRTADVVCGQAVGGRRWDTLVCDGFLPLAAARIGGDDLAGLWWHWWAGDLPAFVEAVHTELSAAVRPTCQGAVQGLIDWALELESAPAGSAVMP